MKSLLFVAIVYKVVRNTWYDMIRRHATSACSSTESLNIACHTSFSTTQMLLCWRDGVYCRSNLSFLTKTPGHIHCDDHASEDRSFLVAHSSYIYCCLIWPLDLIERGRRHNPRALRAEWPHFPFRQKVMMRSNRIIAEIQWECMRVAPQRQCLEGSLHPWASRNDQQAEGMQSRRISPWPPRK
jgi:hypothetical protein